MKKFLALALALVMALSLAACGKKADDNNKGNGDEAKGSVYYLNFKPEADKAWQDLARPTPSRPAWRSRSSPPPPASMTPC